MAASPVTADRDYPQMIVEADHTEPAPRRVRATLGGELIFDSTRARYVWEWAYYPQYYIPVEDVDGRFLVDEQREQRLRQGTARRHGLRAGGADRPGTVRIFGDEAIGGVAGTARFDWDALDAWYEEDEQVFVHPRNPYVRVDALRSHPHVRVSLEGITLADSASPVLVFETGLPTRYYFDRTESTSVISCRQRHRTACPYKGDHQRLLVGAQRSTTRDRTRISPGPTTSRPASCCPSRGWSPSTTRRSTSKSTACGCPEPGLISSGDHHHPCGVPDPSPFPFGSHEVRPRPQAALTVRTDLRNDIHKGDRHAPAAPG